MNNFWLDKIEEEKREWAKDVEWKKNPKEEWVMFIENIGHLYDVSWRWLGEDEELFVVSYTAGESKTKQRVNQWMQCFFEGAPKTRKVMLTRYNGIRSVEQIQIEKVGVVAVNWSDLDYEKSEPLEVEITFSGSQE